MIVTIDGPAGAGKSTVARKLAERLKFQFLDTGAMYRAVALAAIDRDVALNDPDQMVAMASRLVIDVAGAEILVDGRDVSTRIRTSEVTSVIHFAADNPAIRELMVGLQRKVTAGADFVTEGRDQGTVVFPYAECKIFLTATPAERARRRLFDLQARGETADYDRVLADQNERDQRDSEREVGRLHAADDAMVVVTDGMSTDDVVDHLERLVQTTSARGTQAVQNA